VYALVESDSRRSTSYGNWRPPVTLTPTRLGVWPISSSGKAASTKRSTSYGQGRQPMTPLRRHGWSNCLSPTAADDIIRFFTPRPTEPAPAD
jgi:hypothetical protein